MAKTGLEDRYLVAIRSLLQRVMDERGFKQADAAREIAMPRGPIAASIMSSAIGLRVPNPSPRATSPTNCAALSSFVFIRP